MKIITKSPTKTSQSTGGKYTTFAHLSNIQNMNCYISGFSIKPL